ncbi:hypothetical protein PoB_006800900 [Plakobranchus ocellatus]|uniref:Uncharacterized protein n=1 Tax=Plakobranchus ocellatus TaxID=259542 RepID=A0AAV4DBG2_9GAST|nr:hypothetical protein PoB_006800900 [Plakobranchus ocellatus]
MSFEVIALMKTRSVPEQQSQTHYPKAGYRYQALQPDQRIFCYIKCVINFYQVCRETFAQLEQPVYNKVISDFQALHQARARIRDRRVPADIRADSLAIVPPTPPSN